MKLKNIIDALLPSFKKDTVLEDIKLTREELTEFTIPAYSTAVQLLHNWKFKSKDVTALEGTFNRMVKSKHGKNMVVSINDSFRNISQNLDDVEDLIKKTYGEEVASSGMTYLRANLLQFTEAVGFVSKYSRKLLQYIYVCETNTYGDSSASISEVFAPAELEYITSNFISFCTALNAVSGNPQTVKKLIDSIPDIVITKENVDTLEHTVGQSKLDPFQMRLIPIWMNPIYYVGMFVAEWQADRYKAAKEELKLLGLRKMNLEKLHQNKPDAHLQKEIDYMETRIQGLNYKLNKMEQKYGKS